MMIDAHVHLEPGDPAPLPERLAAFGAEGFNLLGVPSLFGPENNLACLGMKRLYPGRAWAFGGLVWQGRSCPRPEQQLESMLQAGFDGLKLLETKPTLQKELGFLPDDPAFAPLFALAEARSIPILWHVGDPAPFWDPARAPAFAVENGWTYEGPGFLSLTELYRRTEAVLERHPRLKVILAHLYFCSDDRDHLERLLERYPNLHLDITPGSEMYSAFARDRAGWEAFFKAHAGRILLGSDTTNGPDDHWQDINGLTRGILQNKPFQVWDIAMAGFDLDPAAYAAITGGNFTRLAGDRPKPINPEGLKALMAFYREHIKGDALSAVEEAYLAFI